jgi:hypothetical protein
MRQYAGTAPRGSADGSQQFEETEFIVLRDGQIYVEGSAAELRASTDPYLEA